MERTHADYEKAADATYQDLKESSQYTLQVFDVKLGSACSYKPTSTPVGARGILGPSVIMFIANNSLNDI